jgi:hypothetical protein
MPLTRHFYNSDEVQSALYYSTTRADYQETLFWTKEYVESGYASEAISTLFESWIWQRGPFHMQWLIHAHQMLTAEEVTEDAILLSAYQLSNCKKRDHSLWNILVLSPTHTNKPPDRITRKESVIPSRSPKVKFFLSALCQRKAQVAWWISTQLSISEVWENLYAHVHHYARDKPYPVFFEALKAYEKILGYPSEEYDIVIRCVAILSVCLTEEQQQESFKEQSQIAERCQESLKEWVGMEGQMKRRIYSIPKASMYGTTKRGTLSWSSSTLIQLHNVEKYIVGCPFWNDAIQEYGMIQKGVIQWTSLEHQEAFYNKFFPDDIPDEWTREEKQKSHGDGLLGPTETPNLLKYGRNYFNRQTRLAWNTTQDVHRYLEKNPVAMCHPNAIVKIIQIEIDEKWLRPVCKKLIL